MVNSQVTLFKDRRQLKLVGGYLVVTGLARNAEFKSLNFKVAHKLLHTFRNGTKVVVVHLLVLGRIMSHQGASCEQQVRTCGIQAFVNQEILLFPTQVSRYAGHIGVKIVTYSRCSLVYSSKSLFERCFIVKGLTSVTYKDGWNHQRVAYNKHRRSRVPSRITTGFES